MKSSTSNLCQFTISEIISRNKNFHTNRQSGGGCYKLTEHDPILMTLLEILLDSNSRGDPQSLKGVIKSAGVKPNQVIKSYPK